MKIVDRSSGWRVFFWISVSKNILKFIAASFFLFILFILFKIYLQLTANRKKKKISSISKNDANLRQLYIYIYKRTIKKYKYIVRKSYKHIGSKRPFIGNQDVENSFCKVYMGSL